MDRKESLSSSDLNRREFIRCLLQLATLAFLNACASGRLITPTSATTPSPTPTPNGADQQTQITPIEPLPPKPDIIFLSPAERQKSKEDFERLYDEWKQSYITADGTLGPDMLRVIMPEEWNREATTSESMGYGMLTSVFADDQQVFDSLFRYTRQYLLPGTNLMNWWVEASGQLSKDDNYLGGATDGDMDIATALLFAAKRWGGEYSSAAENIISDLMKYCVQDSTNVLKPGNEWGGASLLAVSYLSPAQFRMFAEATQNDKWLQAIEKSYQIYDNIYEKSGSPLFPNGATADGGMVTDPWADVDYFYGYNATRTALRLSYAALWQNDSRAAAILSRFNNFWENIDPSQIVDGYQLDGTPIGEWHVGAFVAPVLAASITSQNESFRNSVYEEMLSLIPESYFSDSLGLLVFANLGGIPAELLNQ